MQNKFIGGWDFYFSFRKKPNNHFHKFIVKMQFYNHRISTSISISQSSYFIIFKPIRKLISNQTEISLSIYTFIFNKIKLSLFKKAGWENEFISITPTNQKQKDITQNLQIRIYDCKLLSISHYHKLIRPTKNVPDF